MKRTIFSALAIGGGLLLGLAGPASAGKIVLANDEWTLSYAHYTEPNDPGVFATNVAAWFTGGSAGSFLAYSNNFGLTGTDLANSMTGAGHSWTVSTAVSFDLATLQAYDGVFLAGTAADTTVLTQYVQGGGNVYLAGGTGWGGAGGEAALWNPFLNNFGLGLDTEYNGVSGSIPISSSHPIFNGVDHLHQGNGQDTLDLVAGDNAETLVSYYGHGLYAVYEGAAPVPVPAAGLLLASGLAGLAGVRRVRPRG
ncbi:MAG: VPLPA-CTERM sorting domain-containing protein [Thermodesulfobacteriota bacterium]